MACCELFMIFLASQRSYSSSSSSSLGVEQQSYHIITLCTIAFGRHAMRLASSKSASTLNVSMSIRILDAFLLLALLLLIFVVVVIVVLFVVITVRGYFA